MNDRQRERESGGGALTGATGDLVPPDPADELLTGERRAIESPSGGGHITRPKRDPDEDPSVSESASEPSGGRPIPASGTDAREEEPDRF